VGGRNASEAKLGLPTEAEEASGGLTSSTAHWYQTRPYSLSWYPLGTSNGLITSAKTNVRLPLKGAAASHRNAPIRINFNAAPNEWFLPNRRWIEKDKNFGNVYKTASMCAPTSADARLDGNSYRKE
jgi:hypothetical protein